jgi:hypothetical protein
LKKALPGLLLLLLITVSETVGSVFLVSEGWLQLWWWQALTGHVALSGLAGLGGMRVLRANYSTQGPSVFIFFSLFALCIPVLGSLGVLCLVGYYRYWGTSTASVAIGTVMDPGFRRGGKAHDLQYYSGDVHSILSTASISDMQRMQALFKLQSLQSQQTTHTFRSLLTDKSEDLRLVAFGLLDKTEKTIFSRIHQELTLLNKTVDDENKIEHWRQLAYIYWELVYQQAAVGDVLDFAMDQVRVYATEALFQEERDGGMWSLLGQVNFQTKDYEVARYCFGRALTYGLPESRIVPYMAEVLFAQRDYSNLQILLSIQTSLVDLAALQPVLEYWGVPKPSMETSRVLV